MKLLHHLRICAAPALPAVLLSACALLTGCGTAPPATQTVEVPVYVPCVREKDIPAAPTYEFDRLQPGAADGEKILALARDWPRGRAYESRLRAVIEGCN
jgi:hypothetical protein